MSNCEENKCTNSRTAICLHCRRQLYVTHVVAHEKLVSKESEQVNELTEQLNVRLQKIHRARENVTDECDVWRENQIKKVEQQYAEKIRMIQLKKDHFTYLENRLTQRLIEGAIRPLEFMQTQQSANSESLKRIRQAIINIVDDSAQFDSGLNDSLNQASSPQQYFAIKRQTSVDSSTNLSDTQSSINTQSPLSQPATPKSTAESTTLASTKPNMTPETKASTIPNLTPTTEASTIPNQTPKTKASIKPKLTPKTKASIMPNQTPKTKTSTIPKTKSTAAASVLLTPSQTQAASSIASKTTIIRPPTNPCKRLVSYFQDTSGSSDHLVEQYIVQNLQQAVHVNSLMILLLSFLQAWHSPKSPKEVRHSVLSHHIKMVKKYIKGSEHQLTVLAASQKFLLPCQYDESRCSDLMTTLLQFFLDEQCITKKTILNWYNNGAQYGYSGFGKAKQSAQPFIAQLNSLTKSR